MIRTWRQHVLGMLLMLATAGCFWPDSDDDYRFLGERLERLVPSTDDVVLQTSVSLPKQELILREPARWQLRWQEAHLGRSAVPPVPTIDFDRDMLVLIAAGTQPSLTVRVEVDSAVVRSEGIVVYAAIVSPGCIGLGIGSPAVAVRFPRHDVEPFFHFVHRNPNPC